MRTPESGDARQPATPLEFEFPQFLFAGRADRPFILFGLRKGQFGNHTHSWLTVQTTVIHC